MLEVFDGTQGRLTLSKLAELAKMDLSSAQRLTRTLVKLGYLHKDPGTRTYALSPRLFRFAHGYLANSDLVRRATPYLQQVSAQTGETANITVLDDTDIVFVMRIVSPNVLTADVIVGTRIPAYCTAPGLAMLACLNDDEVREILDRSDLVAHTPRTVADPAAILACISRIRHAGYAHTEDEYFMGDISTAAAIVDGNRRPVGAINIAVARPRWNGAEDEEKVSRIVISAASAISGRR